MKEDLQNALDEQIRQQQEQLRELKELRDSQLNDVSSLYSSTWKGASTNTLVQKFKNQVNSNNLINKMKTIHSTQLGKADIAQMQYFAPVKEINLYQNKQEGRSNSAANNLAKQRKSITVPATPTNEPAALNVGSMNQVETVKSDTT